MSTEGSQYARGRIDLSPEDSAKYAAMGPAALRDLLLNPKQNPGIQRILINQFSKLTPAMRALFLGEAMETIMRKADQFGEEILFALVELFATDPHPEATEALIAGLAPLTEVADQGRLSREFRDYYYAALITRRRETDRAAWRDGLPRLRGDTLLVLLRDPAAGPLRSRIKPLALIDRLPEPERSRTLRRAVFGGAGFEAVRMLFRGR